MKYCKHCGKEVNDGAAVCLNCGCKIDDTQNSPGPARQLKTNRSLLKYILLSIITLGIYGIVVMSNVSTDINTIASRYDGKKTMHYCLVLFIFSWLTLGIVPLVWNHKISDRIGAELTRRGIDYQFGAGTFWGWGILGSLILVGPFIYTHKLLTGRREGFAHLKPSTEYDALYNAALCRERADWMVGINASRLFSCLYGQPLAVGRVMTPVLAMTVVREAAIAAFVPEKFYTVALTLADGGTASSKRFAQKADAELLLSKCRKEGRVTVQKMERKEKSENPPQLYDLTALQRDANRLLGFTAQQTLDYAQSLYEKRLITYPRTDSRFLTEDMAASLPGLVTDTGRAFAEEEPFPIHVQQVINGGKVTDHHALLPTKSMANADLAALPAGERNVLRLIAARLLCAVGEPHCYAETTLTTICAGEEFSAKGKLVLSDGWRAMERKMLGELLGKQKEPAVLPDVQEQSQCSVAGVELKEGQTSPPKHFTEDLLLHAMETASADSMPEGVERQGIGTPATRAATIEKLVQKGFLERKGTKKTKVLLPTDKGKALITVMPEEIQSPEMTADWETKLLQIERGEMEPSEFMTEINTMITELVKNTEMKKGANALMKNKIIGVCPNCGANVVEREKGWFCENRECRFVLWKDNAFFKRLGKRLDSHVADKLLRDGRVRLKDCKSAKGKTYNATVLLSCEADGRSKFSLEFEGGC